MSLISQAMPEKSGVSKLLWTVGHPVEVGDKLQLQININAKLSVLSYQHLTYTSPLKKKLKCKILVMLFQHTTYKSTLNKDCIDGTAFC